MYILKHQSAEVYLAKDTLDPRKPAWTTHVIEAALFSLDFAEDTMKTLKQRGHHVNWHDFP